MMTTHLHPDCTCTHRSGEPCDSTCPVHAGARSPLDTLRGKFTRDAAAGRWAALRLEIQGLRAIHYDHANDLADEGKDAERAFGRVDAYDEVLAWMDREDGQS